MREKRQHYSKDGPEKQEARKTKDMFCFESSHHENSLLNKLNEFYQSQTLCDVTLIAEGQKIKTHKAVLAACSPYFTTMFTTNLKESAQDVIELKDITFLSLQTLVTFCYTSSIEISAETVFELLTAADMLDFTVIKDSTSAFLSSKLTPSNCMEISVFADLHNCQALRSYSLKYAQQNFRHVTRTDAFLEATYEQIEELLSSESLGITTEKDVFEALMVWMKHETANREKCLPSLFKHVRLHLLPPKEIGIVLKIFDAGWNTSIVRQNIVVKAESRTLNTFQNILKARGSNCNSFSSNDCQLFWTLHRSFMTINVNIY